MERTTVAVLTVVALAAALAAVVAQGETAPAVLRASFTEDGSVRLPVGYRAWFHIGTRYKPDGTSILDGQPLTVPEILNAYVEPNALAYFEKTGTWADGTQIVKEMSAIQVGDGCDRTTRICGKSVGTGIFEASYVGLGMMVKDRARFADARGNWGFFSFGHKPPPYDPTSPVRPPQQCAGCHIALASDTDYVIVRAHIGLADRTGN